MKTRSTNSVLVIDKPGPDVESLLKSFASNNFKATRLFDAQKAYEFCLSFKPDVIIMEMNPDIFHGEPLFHQLKNNYSTQNIPVIVTTKIADLEERLRIIRLGISDFITKPYYPEEITSRTENIIQEMEIYRESQQRIEHGFSGRLSEMNLVDLIQTMELGEKSGLIRLTRGDDAGIVIVSKGHIVSALTEELEKQDAILNMLTWVDGTFNVTLQPIEDDELLLQDNASLLKEGIQLIERWRKATKDLPPLQTALKANGLNGPNNLNSLQKKMLSFFSQPKSILTAIKECEQNEIDALLILKSLIDKGLLNSEAQPLDAFQVRRRNDLMLKEADKEKRLKGYSVIASFFRKVNPTKKIMEANASSGNGQRRNASRSIPHKVYLTKGELLLMKQKIQL